MREAMLSQSCEAWDVIRVAEKAVCHGEVIEGWAGPKAVYLFFN
jgi:hypothetical protein